MKLFLPRHAKTHSPGGSDPVTTTRTLLFIMSSSDGLEVGVQGDVQLHAKFEILSWTLLAVDSGSIVVDVWKDAYANFPPDNSDSITGTEQPTISGGVANTSTTLAGWTTTINAGDTLRFNIDSVSTITRCTIALQLRG